MKEIIKVLDAGTIPTNTNMIFIKEMDGKWYKYLYTDECRSYKEAKDQGRVEPVSDSYARSHVLPLSFGSGSLRIVFGIEIVGEDSVTRNRGSFAD